MKTFRFGKHRVQGLMDVYNVLNASAVTVINQTYGSNGSSRRRSCRHATCGSAAV